MWGFKEKDFKKICLKGSKVCKVKYDDNIAWNRIHKEIGIIKKKQKKILVLKNTITEMKNSLQVLNSKFHLSE